VVFRRLSALVAVPLLLIGLSSCRSDPTVAAYVGDAEITVDRVDDYFAEAASDPVSAMQVQQSPGEVKPKLVSMLVFIQLLREAADEANVSVTPAQIAQVKAQLEPQRQMVSGDVALLPLEELSEFQALQVGLSQWARAGGVDDTTAGKKYSDALFAAEKAHPVTVNPRFGTFDLKNAPQMGSSDVAVKPAQTEAAQP